MDDTTSGSEYEPPAGQELGSILELTAGDNPSAADDGAFGGGAEEPLSP